jgi:hypothetical protein
MWPLIFVEASVKATHARPVAKVNFALCKNPHREPHLPGKGDVRRTPGLTVGFFILPDFLHNLLILRVVLFRVNLCC